MDGWNQAGCPQAPSWGAGRWVEEVEGAQAVGEGLNWTLLSSFCAAKIPSPSPASSSRPHFSLSIYREAELVTQPEMHLSWMMGAVGRMMGRTGSEKEMVHLLAT